jgi:hypothetical protein
MTDVPLLRHIDKLLEELDRRYAQRFEANDRALRQADQSLREYKQGSNEWRDALKDANNRMATRADVAKIDEAVRDLQRAKANLDGRIAVYSAVVSSVVSWAIFQWLG